MQVAPVQAAPAVQAFPAQAVQAAPVQAAPVQAAPVQAEPVQAAPIEYDQLEGGQQKARRGQLSMDNGQLVIGWEEPKLYYSVMLVPKVLGQGYKKVVLCAFNPASQNWDAVDPGYEGYNVHPEHGALYLEKKAGLEQSTRCFQWIE
jgi:hypothetical protein